MHQKTTEETVWASKPQKKGFFCTPNRNKDGVYVPMQWRGNNRSLLSRWLNGTIIYYDKYLPEHIADDVESPSAAPSSPPPSASQDVAGCRVQPRAAGCGGCDGQPDCQPPSPSSASAAAWQQQRGQHERRLQLGANHLSVTPQNLAQPQITFRPCFG